MPFSKEFTKDDLEQTKVTLNLHYTDAKELENLELLLECYDRVCQRNQKLKEEALDKQMEIFDLYQEMEEIKDVQGKTKRMIEDISCKIYGHQRSFEDIKADTMK